MNRNGSRETCMKTIAPIQDKEKGEALIWQDMPIDMMWLAKEKEILRVTSKF